MLIGQSQKFLRIAFDDEAEIEKVVADNNELLFGASTVFLQQQRINTVGGKATLPDAIVIDLENNQWYIVEVERAAHGTWEHIAPQVSKQLAAIANEDTRDLLLKLALEEVSSNETLKEALKELGIEEISVHGRIDDILKKRPIVAIPIDEIPPDLTDWTATLKHQVKIWLVEKYSETSTGQVLYSMPDEFAPSLDTGDEAGPVSATRSSGGIAFRKVLRAGLLEIGQELWMEYGPRGQAKKKYTSLVREDGLEVDGKVYSPSYAVVACMKKAGSDRSTANGWTQWKTDEGIVIDELYKKLSEQNDGSAPQVSD